MERWTVIVRNIVLDEHGHECTFLPLAKTKVRSSASFFLLCSKFIGSVFNMSEITSCEMISTIYERISQKYMGESHEKW